MKIKNKDLESLGKLLYELPLKGKVSRMRTRFVKLLNEYYQNTFQEERNALIRQYAERDSNGDIKIDSEDSSVVKIEEELKEEFFLELEVLMNEYFYVEENEGNKEMLLTVSDLILEGDFEVAGEVADMYDNWCNEFEAMSSKYRANEEECNGN